MGDIKPWPKLARQSQTKDAIVRVAAEAKGPAYAGLGAQFYAPGIGTLILVAANLEVLETAAAHVGCALKAELAGPVLVFGDSRGAGNAGVLVRDGQTLLPSDVDGQPLEPSEAKDAAK